MVGAIDVDLSYGVLNSALVVANWRATDKLTLNGRFNVGAAPYLTTRNALIGRSEASVDDLLETYSEEQVRTLARDRTAQMRNAAVGVGWPLFDRFQVNADIGFYDFDATVESGGVSALPDRGRQTFFYTSFVGSSIVKDGDTAMFSYRRSSTHSATSDTVLFDWRLPTTHRLRLNPRLALSSRSMVGETSDEWVAAPMLRVGYRWPRHHQFEVELGAALATREIIVLDPMGLTAPDGGQLRVLHKRRLLVGVLSMANTMRRMLLATLLAAIYGCASEPPVQSALDDKGVTWSSTPALITLARSAPRFSAAARDYLYVAPMEENDSGKRRHYLWLGSASTVDRARSGATPSIGRCAVHHRRRCTHSVAAHAVGARLRHARRTTRRRRSTQPSARR